MPVSKAEGENAWLITYWPLCFHWLAAHTHSVTFPWPKQIAQLHQTPRKQRSTFLRYACKESGKYLMSSTNDYHTLYWFLCIEVYYSRLQCIQNWEPYSGKIQLCRNNFAYLQQSSKWKTLVVITRCFFWLHILKLTSLQIHFRI